MHASARARWVVNCAAGRVRAQRLRAAAHHAAKNRSSPGAQPLSRLALPSVLRACMHAQRRVKSMCAQAYARWVKECVGKPRAGRGRKAAARRMLRRAGRGSRRAHLGSRGCRRGWRAARRRRGARVIACGECPPTTARPARVMAIAVLLGPHGGPPPAAPGGYPTGSHRDLGSTRHREIGQHP